MNERKVKRVQRLTVYQLQRPGGRLAIFSLDSPQGLLPPPVFRVAEDGMTQMGKMGSNLMGPPRAQSDFQQLGEIKIFQNLIFRHRRTGVLLGYNHFFSVGRRSSQRQINQSLFSLQMP